MRRTFAAALAGRPGALAAGLVFGLSGCGASDEPPPVPAHWQLVTLEGAQASLDTLTGGVLLVTGMVSEYRTPWHLQLRKPGFGMIAGVPYVLRFRARSSAPRRISYAIVMDHPPWSGLTPWEEADLVPLWRRYEAAVSASATDPLAQIMFHLGRDTTTLEIANVSLTRVPDNALIVGDDPPTGR